jgi:hypothetical protein
VAKRRREFVKNDDEDEENGSSGATQFQFPPPLQPFLLPDDSADEDYHDDEAGNQAYGSGSSSDEGGSDDFVARDDEQNQSNNAAGDEEDGEEDEDGPVTRSRAGQLRQRSLSPAVRTAIASRRPRNVSSSGNRRGRGRRSNGPGRPPSHGTRKRRRERSDDEEDMPLRPRTRRRAVPVSYLESDVEKSEEESTSSEDEDNDGQFTDSSEAGPSNMTISHQPASSSLPQDRDTPTPEPQDRKGKRKLRQRISDDEDDGDFYAPPSSSSAPPPRAAASSSSSSGRATRSGRSHAPSTEPMHPAASSSSSSSHTKPAHTPAKPGRRPGKRETPRELTSSEIKLYEPIPWIKNCERSLSKYLPQLNDTVAILTEGHKQYLDSSEMKEYFDERHGVITKHGPVIFARVANIQWVVGPPTFCRLKLLLLQLGNIAAALQGAAPEWVPLGQEAVIDYTDEDGSPEFIVLWQRFQASMDLFGTITDNQRVDAMYDDDKYTGTIMSCNKRGLYWKQAHLPSPWAYYHITWDDESSAPEDLCPWEIVPHGEDFLERYDVEPSLPQADVERAQEIIEWLKQSEDFLLYVEQVDYYNYPTYLTMIAYPICLDTVMERLSNNFYRSVDVSYLVFL